MNSPQTPIPQSRKPVAGHPGRGRAPSVPKRRTEKAKPAIDVPVPLPPESPFVRDSYASTALAGDRRPLGARRGRPLHRRAVADGADRGLHGLGGPPRRSRRASRRSWPRRRSRRRRGSPTTPARSAAARRRRRAVHRAAAAGPALRRRSLAQSALRRHLPGVPAQPAVVAQRDDRRARRHPAQREHGRRSRPGSSSTCSRRRTSC